MKLMKSILLLVCFLGGLALNLSLAQGSPGSTKLRRQAAARTATTGLGIAITPASATYTVGQSVTVSITGGTAGTKYVLQGYNGDPLTATLITGDLDLTNDLGGENSITWGASDVSRYFVVKFKGAVGMGRVLEISTEDFSEYSDTAPFEILPKPTLGLTLSPASVSYNTGQSVTATVTGGIVGETYVVKLYKNTPDDANDLLNFIRPTNSQGGTAAIAWGPSTSSEQFYVQFVSGSEGATQLLEITNLDFTHTVDSSPFSVTPCSLSVSVSPSSQTITSGGSVTLTASGATTYTWSNGSTANPLIVSNVTSATAFSVTGVTGTCSATASAAVSVSAAPIITGSTSYTVTKAVLASTDDAEQAGTNSTNGSFGPGAIYLASSDLELTEDNAFNTGNQTIGIRFTSLSIPHNATITSAYITFYGVASNSSNGTIGTANVTIKGQAADDALTFGTSVNDISNRPTTTTSVSWSATNWALNTSFNSADLTPVVQEVINRAGWASGNSMAFIITGSGSSNVRSFDGSASNAPNLVIMYQIPACTNPTVSITPSSQTITSGGSVTLTASGATTYTWSNGSTANPLIVSNVTSATAFSVTGVTGTCSATASATVSICSPPATTLTASGSLTICPGQSLTLTASGEAGATPAYTWSTGERTAALPVSPTSTSAYSVTVTNTATGCFSITGLTVTVKPAVTASIGGNQELTCNQSLTLTASGSGSNFTWSANAGSSSSAQVVVRPAQTGTVYSVTMTDPGTGCSGVASVTATLAPSLAAQAISSTAMSTLSASNCPVMIQSTGTGNAFVFTNPVTGFSYSTVYRRGGTYTLPAFPVKQPGTYTMTAYYTDACGATSTDTRTFVVTGTGCN